MSEIKNHQTVKLRLDEADNMIMVMQDVIRRGLKIDPREAQDRFAQIRKKIQFAMNNISG